MQNALITPNDPKYQRKQHTINMRGEQNSRTNTYKNNKTTIVEETEQKIPQQTIETHLIV